MIKTKSSMDRYEREQKLINIASDTLHLLDGTIPKWQHKAPQTILIKLNREWKN